MQVFNETMLIALASILASAQAEIDVSNVDISNEPQEFFEVDLSKFSGKRTINFGARVFSNDFERNEEFLKKLGPSLNTAMWGAVWEVSAAGPAPVNEGDQKLKDWIETVYINLAYYMDSMKNTSEVLRVNDIALINSFTNPPNAYYSTPNQIERIDKNVTWEDAKEVLDQSAEGDSYNLLMRSRIDDYVKFWIYSLEHLKNEGFTIPYFELTDEPDNKEGSIYMEPEDYLYALKEVSKGLKESGQDNKIIGPATSTPEAAEDYIKLISQDREAYDALNKWSFRIWDDGRSLLALEKQILRFGKLIKNLIPSDWPKKPLVVYFGLRLKNSEFVGDYDLSNYGEDCYEKLYGAYIYKSDYLENSFSQAPAVGVRILADIFTLYSNGARTVVYDHLFDHNWSTSCFGLFDRESRAKQLYAALSTFLPYVDADMKVTKKQWVNSEECVLISVQSDKRVVFGIANLGSAPCTRSLSLSGIDYNKILSAETIAYNNGTVSLQAEQAYEALVSKGNLSYDVYADENVVEFDVTVIPKASATVVFDIGEPQQAESEHVAEGSQEEVEEIIIDALDEEKTEKNHKEL